MGNSEFSASKRLGRCGYPIWIYTKWAQYIRVTSATLRPAWAYWDSAEPWPILSILTRFSVKRQSIWGLEKASQGKQFYWSRQGTALRGQNMTSNSGRAWPTRPPSSCSAELWRQQTSSGWTCFTCYRPLCTAFGSDPWRTAIWRENGQTN